MADHVLDQIFKNIFNLLKPEDFQIGTPLSLEKATEYYGVKNVTEAEAEALRVRSRKGEAEAFHQLGVCHFYGLGDCEQDYQKAFYLSSQAAMKDNVKAMFTIATRLFTVGYEREKEHLIAGAILLFAHCAEAGFAPAKYYLWRIDQEERKYSHFYPSNSDEALRYKLLQEAAEAGYPPARQSLSTLKGPPAKTKAATNLMKTAEA